MPTLLNSRTESHKPLLLLCVCRLCVTVMRCVSLGMKVQAALSASRAHSVRALPLQLLRWRAPLARRAKPPTGPARRPVHVSKSFKNELLAVLQLSHCLLLAAAAACMEPATTGQSTKQCMPGPLRSGWNLHVSLLQSNMRSMLSNRWSLQL